MRVIALVGLRPWRQLRLNQWVKQSLRWMPMDVWNHNSNQWTWRSWKAGCAMRLAPVDSASMVALPLHCLFHRGYFH